MGIEDHPNTNQKEKELQVFTAHIDGFDTYALVGRLNKWWDDACIANHLDPRDEKIEEIGYCVIELSKNALEYANGGEIKVTFEINKITGVITDRGQGFEDPNDDITYNPGHGLSEVNDYADEFIVETNGKKFVKVPKNEKLVSSEETDIQEGTRITFIKRL